jgi:hypothetical protein
MAQGKSRVKAKFKPDYRAFHRFATSEQMLQPVYEAGHDVREIAKTIAPRSDGPGPHYADEFKVDASAGTVKIGRFSRIIVTVVNENKAAAPLEFGNQHVKAQHPLGRAGSMVGEYRGSMPGD